LGRPAGSLRFLVDLSAPAVLNHPGEPSRCMCSLLHGQFQASPVPEGWPLPSLGFDEAESGSLALRPTPSRSQAPAVRLPSSPLGLLHGERAITMISSFQLARSTISLMHQNKATARCKDFGEDALSTKFADCPVSMVRNVAGSRSPDDVPQRRSPWSASDNCCNHRSEADAAAL